jgi:predicted nucleic acid-binding protein
MDQDTWVRAGDLNRLLKQKGEMLALGDLIISALALGNDIAVYTLNGDFDRVPGLKRHEPDTR